MELKKQQMILRIVDLFYKQDVGQLNLINKVKQWEDVVKFRDWSMLKILNLNCCQVTDQSVMLLVNLNYSLTALHLLGNKLTIRGVRELMSWDWPSLLSLNLTDNIIGDEGLYTILKKLANMLINLWIARCKITHLGMESMVNYSPIRMKELILNGNYIGNKGSKLLIKSEMPLLETLQIIDCGIGTQGIKHLVKAQWPCLSSYRMGYYQNENSRNWHLDGWQMMNHSQWKALNQLWVYEEQPICWLNCMLIQTQKLQFFKYITEIENDELLNSIKCILQKREFNFLDFQ